LKKRLPSATFFARVNAAPIFGAKLSRDGRDTT
jgi:hypothetical protein